MIKGVNKQIIEVCDTGNKYFEKAILFVRPEYMSESDLGLRKEANRVLEGIGNPPTRKNKAGISKKAAKRKRASFLFFTGGLITACLLLCYIITRIF